jgi:hypothetical protein
MQTVLNGCIRKRAWCTIAGVHPTIGKRASSIDAQQVESFRNRERDHRKMGPQGQEGMSSMRRELEEVHQKMGSLAQQREEVKISATAERSAVRGAPENMKAKILVDEYRVSVCVPCLT